MKEKLLTSSNFESLASSSSEYVTHCDSSTVPNSPVPKNLTLTLVPLANKLVLSAGCHSNLACLANPISSKLMLAPSSDAFVVWGISSSIDSSYKKDQDQITWTRNCTWWCGTCDFALCRYCPFQLQSLQIHPPLLSWIIFEPTRRSYSSCSFCKWSLFNFWKHLEPNWGTNSIPEEVTGTFSELWQKVKRIKLI